MKILAPDYYKNFKCIAGDCKHSCCIGWEIDIDEETYSYYKTVEGEFGEKLRKNIVENDGVACFRMMKGDRCPFLNEQGLCDVILTLGYDKISQVCDDHPRFRNFYSDRTEIGLGLCCEAAAKIILSQKEKTKLIGIEDEDELLWEDEEDFLLDREEIFKVLQDRTKSVDMRVKEVLDMCEVNFPNKTIKEWAEIYYGFEKLDEERDLILNRLMTADESELVLPVKEEYELWFENLLVYFTFRHLTESLDDDRFKERIAFVVLSYIMIKSAVAVHYNSKGNVTIDDITEICRVYSSEIEYCPDNIESLLGILDC